MCAKFRQPRRSSASKAQIFLQTLALFYRPFSGRSPIKGDAGIGRDPNQDRASLMSFRSKMNLSGRTPIDGCSFTLCNAVASASLMTWDTPYISSGGVGFNFAIFGRRSFPTLPKSDALIHGSFLFARLNVAWLVSASLNRFPSNSCRSDPRRLAGFPFSSTVSAWSNPRHGATQLRRRKLDVLDVCIVRRRDQRCASIFSRCCEQCHENAAGTFSLRRRSGAADQEISIVRKIEFMALIGYEALVILASRGFPVFRLNIKRGDCRRRNRIPSHQSAGYRPAAK